MKSETLKELKKEAEELGIDMVPLSGALLTAYDKVVQLIRDRITELKEQPTEKQKKYYHKHLPEDVAIECVESLVKHNSEIIKELERLLDYGE